MRDAEQVIEALDAERALAIEEVGDVRLLEAGEVGKLEAGDFAGVDALPQRLAEVLL